MRPTEARVSRAAIRGNVAALMNLAPRARMCAVVKADGYGHGVENAAAAALAAGASWLAVATLEEADTLAELVGPATPILILGELDPTELEAALAMSGSRLRLTIASWSGARSLAAVVSPDRELSVHLKVDTGMHRLGVDRSDVVAVARELVSARGVRLEGVWTHLAVADRPDDPFTSEQLRRFEDALDELASAGIDAEIVHAANSAGVIAHPESHRDLVRAGIAMYGVDPDPALTGRLDLVPALTLVSRVRAVRTVETGEGVSYGRRWRADQPTRVATVPIGYADGIRRASPAAGVEVLVRGRRRPMLGVVTMDQLMIAVDDDVDIGDEVVLIGRQGTDEISANEIGARLGTIGYEVLTSIGPRVPRISVDSA